MDQQTLLIVLTIFVIISAVALCVQAGMLIAIYVISKRTQEKVTAVLPQATQVLQTAEITLKETQKHVSGIGERATEMLDLTKGQLNKIDELLNDATTRAKVQMERAEIVLDDTMSRAQDTVGLVHRGIVTPIREVHGLLAGLRATIAFIGRGSRPTVDHATADEEMFI